MNLKFEFPANFPRLETGEGNSNTILGKAFSWHLMVSNHNMAFLTLVRVEVLQALNPLASFHIFEVHDVNRALDAPLGSILFCQRHACAWASGSAHKKSIFDCFVYPRCIH